MMKPRDEPLRSAGSFSAGAYTPRTRCHLPLASHEFSEENGSLKSTCDLNTQLTPRHSCLLLSRSCFSSKCIRLLGFTHNIFKFISFLCARTFFQPDTSLGSEHITHGALPVDSSHKSPAPSDKAEWPWGRLSSSSRYLIQKYIPRQKTVDQIYQNCWKLALKSYIF